MTEMQNTLTKGQSKCCPIKFSLGGGGVDSKTTNDGMCDPPPSVSMMIALQRRSFHTDPQSTVQCNPSEG